MVIKSGEGVVYLTRPQKFSQSSPHPDSLTFFFTCNPDLYAQAHQNGRQFPQYGQLPKKKMK